jgi:hypothetical protein
MTRRQLLTPLSIGFMAIGTAVVVLSWNASFTGDPIATRLVGWSLITLGALIWLGLFVTAGRDPATGKLVDAGPIGFVVNAVHQKRIMAETRPEPSLSMVVTRGDKPDEAKQAYRRKLVADGRRLVAEFNKQVRVTSLIEFLGRCEEWPGIRAQLDPKVRRDLENGRLLVAPVGNEKDGKVYYLMDEMTRLEKEWDLA